MQCRYDEVDLRNIFNFPRLDRAGAQGTSMNLVGMGLTHRITCFFMGKVEMD